MLASAFTQFSRPAAKIKVTVNGRSLEANKGETILQLADRNHIPIPRLCYHPCLALQGSCGMCVVQCKDAKGKETLSNACVTKVSNGMTVETCSQRVSQSVHDKLQGLLDVHDERCSTCVANNRCEFKNMVFSHGVVNTKRCPPIPDSIDESCHSVRIDPSKCVLCGRCVRACKNIAGQKVLKVAAKGKRQCIQTTTGAKLNDTSCVKCGQCTLYCPVGAITEKAEENVLLQAMKDRKKKLYVCQVHPAAKVAISEALGLDAGTISTGKLVGALKNLGFDLVFDTAFACDLHAMQSAEELIEHLNNQKDGVLFTSTCPSFINYVEQSRADLIPQISKLKSPVAILSGLIKHTLPKQMQLQAEDIYSVCVTPCTATKDEVNKASLNVNGVKETDVCLTIRELVEMLKLVGINFADIPDEGQFDNVYGFGSGGGQMYGTSGGVMEATLRVAYGILNGKKMPKPVIQQIRGMQAQKVAEVDLGTKKVKVAVVQGLANAMKLLDKIKKKDKAVKDVRFVEVLSCPGGCVCGGGTPKPRTKEALEERTKAIYELDAKAKIRCPCENTLVKDTVKELKDLGNVHEILRTTYSRRSGV